MNEHQQSRFVHRWQCASDGEVGTVSVWLICPHWAECYQTPAGMIIPVARTLTYFHKSRKTAPPSFPLYLPPPYYPGPAWGSLGYPLALQPATAPVPQPLSLWPKQAWAWWEGGVPGTGAHTPACRPMAPNRPPRLGPLTSPQHP